MPKVPKFEIVEAPTPDPAWPGGWVVLRSPGEGAVVVEADPAARAKTLALRQRVALLEERLEILGQIEALRAKVRALDDQIAALPQVEV